MEILNDLTKCNFYYYILGGNKAYLIFKYLQLIKNNVCIGDAFIRKQKIRMDNNGQRIVRFLNNDLIPQYNVLKQLKSNQIINLNEKLVYFSQLGYLLVVQYLVSKGANIHAADDWALQMAAGEGHLQVVQYLLQPYGLNNFLNRKYGANIHANNDQALVLVTKLGYLNIVQYLVSKGANIHADNDWVLGYAAENGHLAIVQYLFSIGANIHASNDQVLRLAAGQGHLPVVKYLISIGVNIHAQNDQVLRLAASYGHLDVVQYLVSKGADSNVLTAKQKLKYNIN